MDNLSPEEQLIYVTKGASQVINEEELLKKLKKSVEKNSPLVIKVGFDPSAPDIHLGHAVIIRKMKHFQDMGHKVVFLIGDFTGLIGDPSGKNKTRPQLSKEQVEENAETYRKQVFKILDPEKTVVEFNSRWLGKLGAEGFIHLASKYTVARILERDDFKNRLNKNLPISMHELLYPLAQAYDSVMLKCDVEMGGTDQTFNLLVGRDIMREWDLEPQCVMTMPLLVGTDGVEKMSKSLGNYIGINEPARDMFGKLMSISDELMWDYYLLCTDLTVQEIDMLKGKVEKGELHPKKAKSQLAGIIISYYHSEEAALLAEEEFNRIFAKKELPDEIPEYTLSCSSEGIWLPKLMNDTGLARSNGEARRLIKGGAVSIDGEKVSDENFTLPLSSCGELIVKVGKRKFMKIIVEGSIG